jgi:DNA-binding NarL/FixJ family response regulator
MSIRIVLVDDEHLVRAGLRLILESEDDLEVVGEADDGAAAVEVVTATDPDVVLMDIQMPGMNGLEATRQIVGLGREESSRVLILTTFELDEYVYDALRAGASGFLLKRTPATELVNAIRVVAEGEALLAPSVTRRLIDEFARRATGPRRRRWTTSPPASAKCCSSSPRA